MTAIIIQAVGCAMVLTSVVMLVVIDDIYFNADPLKILLIIGVILLIVGRCIN